MPEIKIKDNIFLQATKPSRYIGSEINSVKKEWTHEKINLPYASQNLMK